MSGDRDEGATRRRRFLRALTAGGVGGLAGCGSGGDDGTATAPLASTSSAAPTPTTGDAASTATEAPTSSAPPGTDTTPSGVVEGRTYRVHVPPREEPTAGYNPLDDGTFWFDGHDAMRLTLFERSL
ncbi:MAG: hypothetical protein ABEJ42_00290, partial [Halobacteriaceae archaeon]